MGFGTHRSLAVGLPLADVPLVQGAEALSDLWDIVDSNVQDGDKAKGAVAVDAFPGLGKTT